jgi:hypothetical protein
LLPQVILKSMATDGHETIHFPVYISGGYAEAVAVKSI